MNDLKPCPFCNGAPITYKFKKDRKKVYGIYYDICYLKCNQCGCTISQAGATKEQAEENAKLMWNRRVNNE